MSASHGSRPPAPSADLLAGVRARMRRHRRPLAAALAFLAVLTLGSALRPPAPDTPGTLPPLAAGQVAVPVSLASAAVAATLRAGDHVDVVVARTGSVVARSARVLEPPAGGGFAASGTAVVVLGTDRASALATLAAESAGDGLSVLRVQP